MYRPIDLSRNSQPHLPDTTKTQQRKAYQTTIPKNKNSTTKTIPNKRRKPYQTFVPLIAIDLQPSASPHSECKTFKARFWP